MGIGTSLGAYYEDEFAYQARDAIKNKAEVTQVADRKTASPLVTITDQDIEQGMGLAMGFAGGGLSTVGKGVETVGSAALKYKDEIFKGVNHGDALNKIIDQHGPDFNWKHVDDGFMTSHDRFVSREDAFKLADKAKQIDAKQFNVPEGEQGMLLSEDLPGSVAFEMDTGPRPGGKPFVEPEPAPDTSWMENPVQQQQAKARGPNEPTQMRKAANDNYAPGDPKRPYNIQDPTMIGSDAADAALEASWKRMGESQRMQDKIDELLAKKDDSEIHIARIKKLQKQWQDQYGPGSE